ncbi:MAG: sn-glycerol-3-phosphate ABC transporter ATP-binding protein UgpC [Hoeflea sp.]|uniref:ABC transporter ATP-binding protein n=1 Tax=Hoeflea sp. TaxID=1940281 RepID=UPI001D911901|nr:sn-glycerol-3-phosphate ABC transporter ATP-binding protein UgpC [Hoeflea sp.]MBU4528064.1 sn-glycerol-3-phosphate ABC transporter ATP-binding protein UgpC [Alphaproteobacteria bacterium]MBU4543661.1 sn-glycerol-3-phosphate ABC transporter ATP-binding protein UgpC [Alphaproteobacteria bacterium]MBU4548527.1 sn-glycerol-3-phosphate ABC transporter ATP-binding protein UgpC [Alphaproteobacteria bacterium]MBV1725694.1 sn-glycerol-3-phosphate ABC transporter ATP-binding protein UgpC [Hoeflea sp.]
MARLVLDNITKSFGTVQVINGIDLAIAHREFVVFVGPSGCGKSTMLRMIAGLESVSGGRIVIGDRDVTHVAPSKREIAMVFQSYALFPHLTVAENIGFGLRLANTPKAEIDRQVGEVARTLQIEQLLERKPRHLSGGQRQRVAIGRSIIRNPKVFLFDEPLSNLDASLRVQMRLEIARLHQRLDATMVYVTHDQTEAMSLADRIVVFNAGRIEQVGTPIELYEKPANTFVAGFIGAPSMNFIEARIDSSGGAPIARFGPASIPLADAERRFQPGGVTLGVRPEHILIAEGRTPDFTATVEIVEKLGAESLVYLQTGFSPDPVTMRVSPEHPVKPGDSLPLCLDQNRVHCFASDGAAI